MRYKAGKEGKIKMKQLLTIMLFLFLASICNAADKNQLALELLELSHFKQTIDNSINSYSDQMLQAMPGLTKDEIKQYLELAMGWEKMKPALIQAVSEIYTQEELIGIIKFMKTPIGAAYTEKGPIFAKKFSELIMGNIQQAIQYLQNLYQSKRQENK